MYRLGGGHLGVPLFLQRRAIVKDKYDQLRQTHPALSADLRDFQVYHGSLLLDLIAISKILLQADIAGATIDQQDHHHILSCLPTGMGKTLPMLITACLLPPGDIPQLMVSLLYNVELLLKVQQPYSLCR